MLDCIVDIEQSAIDPLSNVVIKDQGRRVFVPVPQSIQQTIDLSNRGIIFNWRCQSWCPSAGSVGTLARTVSPLFAVKQLISNSTASRRPRTHRFNGKLNYRAFMAIYAKPTTTRGHSALSDYLPLSIFRNMLIADSLETPLGPKTRVKPPNCAFRKKI